MRNGERYLAEALDSLLAQTFTDFELIISDNASTDKTEDICRAYAARDPRIRYSRLETNIGGFRNHNRVVALARGEYFTWAAHDDVRAADHLACCVEALERDTDSILSFTRIRYIDGDGVTLAMETEPPPMDSAQPRHRWRNAALGEASYDAQHGIARTSVLRRTRLFGSYPGADRVLLCELALQGAFRFIDEPLFMKRMHPEQSSKQHQPRGSYRAWYDPGLPPARTYPAFAVLKGLLTGLFQVPLPPTERISCLATLVHWVIRNHYGLRYDLGLTRTQLLGVKARWERRFA